MRIWLPILGVVAIAGATLQQAPSCAANGLRAEEGPGDLLGACHRQLVAANQALASASEDRAQQIAPRKRFETGTRQPGMETRMVTKEAGKSFSALGLSGASREPVETRVSDTYVQSYGTPGSIPEVEQLVVTGAAGEDDFGLQGRVTLIVSDRALALLRQHGLAQAQIFPYDPAYRVPTMEELLGRRT